MQWLPPAWLVETWSFEDGLAAEDWVDASSLPGPGGDVAQQLAGERADAAYAAEVRSRHPFDADGDHRAAPAPDAGEGWPRNGSSVETLLGVVPTALSEAQQIDHLIALEVLKARVDAGQVRTLGALAAGEEAEDHLLGIDVGLALNLSANAAATRIAHARRLCGSLRATLDALQSGLIPLRHADAICEAVERLPDLSTHADLEAMVLPRAVTQTRAELVRSLNRAVLRVDAAGAERRHVRAKADRSVIRYPSPDGMASLVFCGTATDVATVYNRLDAAAHLLPTDRTVDPRSMDQKRADLLVDAMTAGLPVAGLPRRHGRAPAAEVTVALSTLLGFDDEPGELSGYGPIPAGLARDLATETDCTWRRLVTDPATGMVLDYGRTTYRPPAGLRDFVLARDRVCAAPGCHTAARRCDLDHVQPWDDGGSTSSANLAALCAKHHDAKTRKRLRYRRDADGGYTWITRTGHRYRSQPPPAGSPPTGSSTAGCSPAG